MLVSFFAGIVLFCLDSGYFCRISLRCFADRGYYSLSQVHKEVTLTICSERTSPTILRASTGFMHVWVFKNRLRTCSDSD